LVSPPLMHAGSELWAALGILLTRVTGLALISFGGVSTILPALHHLAVNEQRWMTDRDFANLFALASISPGPNFMVLTLIGYKGAGVPGAIVATLALSIPTSLLAFAVVKVWDRFKTAHWRMAIQEGLVPVTVGFVGAAAVLLVRASDNSIPAYAITAAVAAVGTWTRFNPLWIFAVSAIVGALGLV
jgi:chromate transporter